MTVSISVHRPSSVSYADYVYREAIRSCHRLERYARFVSPSSTQPLYSTKLMSHALNTAQDLSAQQHTVHRLYHYRKSISTRPYLARGMRVTRCQMCLLQTPYCMCPFRRQLNTRASFLLLMYDDEVLKPSNSGRLIADLVPDTYAYLWSRTHEYA